MTDENRSIQMQLWIQLRSWIPHFTEAELRVWTYLASKVGRGDEKLPAGEQRKLSVFPLVSTITAETGLKERAVYKALKTLKARGLLTTYSRGKANGYVLNHRIKPDTCTPVHPNTCTPMQVSDENTCTNVQGNTCTTVHAEGFNTEGINEELKGEPTPNQGTIEKEEAGKTEDAEEIPGLVEHVAKLYATHFCWHVMSTTDPKVRAKATAVGQRIVGLGADPFLVLENLYCHWHDFALYSKGEPGCWIFNKKNHLKELPDLDDLLFPQVLSAVIAFMPVAATEDSDDE